MLAFFDLPTSVPVRVCKDFEADADVYMGGFTADIESRTGLGTSDFHF